MPKSITYHGANGVTDDMNDVEMISARGSLAESIIKEFTVYNADSASAEVTISIDNNAVNQRVLIKQTLSAGETLHWEGTTILDASQALIIVLTAASATDLDWTVSYMTVTTS